VFSASLLANSDDNSSEQGFAIFFVVGRKRSQDCRE
jgi:hypothetical protein